MAVKEQWMSQEAHETKDGTTMTRVFATTWNDWLDGTFDYFVGDTLGPGFGPVLDGLRITDIRIRALDNVNIIATTLYSTEATTSKQNAVPDVIESWEETLDFGMEETSVTRYLHYTDPEAGTSTEKDWAAVWAEFGNGADLPELILQKTKATYTITAYGSSFFISSILGSLGKINSNDFLSDYFYDQYDVPDDTAGLADVGKWLFKACPIERVRHNCWRYEMIFEYDDDGWNYQNGLSDNVSLYKLTDFRDLLDSMRGTASDRNVPAGGRT